MMTAGMRVSDDVANEYTNLRMKRSHRYLIIRVNDDKDEVILDQVGERDATFEQFKEAMPKDQPRFAVFELEFTGNSGANEAKIVFILYAPDICDSGAKFIYATSKDVVRKKVQPFNKEIQVNDWADLDDEAFIKYFKH
ncbi:actin depolymerizing factor 1 [Stylonychia lemnae]|uniref:Actin depolymerizing factor 1 n=1 Tax=Stylonychia lemnae TaxID=5949 RepID=A0A077ZWV8_STYLE|nr:actin depolymerizing factor 1 [Stylonychia lemnae]|eukprot:CDW73772.1 actin depolymerizing factor 1 [Stylonychia lemnae]